MQKERENASFFFFLSYASFFSHKRMQQEREKTSVKEKRNVCERKEKETSACKRKEKKRVQKSKVSTQKQGYKKVFFSFLLHTLFFFVPRGKREKVSAKEKSINAKTSVR